EPDPAIDEAAGGVVRERGSLRFVGAGVGRGGIGQQTELDQDLKAVADADDGRASRDGAVDGAIEAMAQAIGEDAAGSDVVAEAEAAGEADEVSFVDDGRLIDELVEVDGAGGSASELEGMLEFAVAVGASGTDDQGRGAHT